MQYDTWVFYPEDQDVLKEPGGQLVVPDLDASSGPWVEAESAEDAAAKVIKEAWIDCDEAADPAQVPYGGKMERVYMVAVRRHTEDNRLHWEYFSQVQKVVHTASALQLLPGGMFRHDDTIEGYDRPQPGELVES